MSTSCDFEMFFARDPITLFVMLAGSLEKQNTQIVILDICIRENSDDGGWEATIYYSGEWK